MSTRKMPSWGSVVDPTFFPVDLGCTTSQWDPAKGVFWLTPVFHKRVALVHFIHELGHFASVRSAKTLFEPNFGLGAFNEPDFEQRNALSELRAEWAARWLARNLDWSDHPLVKADNVLPDLPKDLVFTPAAFRADGLLQYDDFTPEGLQPLRDFWIKQGPPEELEGDRILKALNSSAMYLRSHRHQDPVFAYGVS